MTSTPHPVPTAYAPPSHSPVATVATVAPMPHAAPADPAIGPIVARAVRRRHFAVLASASASGRPHSAGVSYQLADGHLWVSTYRDSRKGRNVAARPEVALSIPVRRIPFIPPSTVQIQARADIVELDDPDLRRLAASGALKKVTSHGELELDGGVFLRIALPSRVPVYALGMSLWALARDPLGADRVALVDWSA